MRIRILEKIKSILFSDKKTPSATIVDLGISSKAAIGSNVEITNTVVDDYSYISKNSIISSSNIGRFCSIGPNVVIGYGDHPINFVSTSPICYQKETDFDIRPLESKFNGYSKVVIENDVWIGANCYIKNGVTISNGAIVAAGAVVIKDVLPYQIVGGVPAKLIRYRFTQENIDELLQIKWWNWNYELIKERLDDIGSENITEFIKKFKEKTFTID